MKIVTAGSPYIDIDAYSCAIAYAELLNLCGDQAIAASTAPWNESICPNVRSWEGKISTDYIPAKDDTFVLVDVSDPVYFDSMVIVSKVVEVIDHHVSFEEYWRSRIGNEANIEFIGAAATLVYERWKQTDKITEMSQTSARLLLTAILDNTLNFGAMVTSRRDHEAYKALLPLAGLPADWHVKYFGECEQNMLANLPTAIKNDTKTQEFHDLPGITHFGQLVVWDGLAFFDEHALRIGKVMMSLGSQWFINIIALKQKRSYLYSKQGRTQEFITALLGVPFNDNVALMSRMWLRKEIIKKATASVLDSADV